MSGNNSSTSSGRRVADTNGANLSNDNTQYNSSETTTLSVTLAQRVMRGDEPSPEILQHFRGHRDHVTALDFHPNLGRLISGCKDGSLMLWNYVDTKHRALRFEGHKKAVNDLAFNGSGDLMVSASDDGTLRLWVPTSHGDTRVFLRAHHSAVRSVAWSPNSEELASASDDKSVKLWCVRRSSHEQRKIPTHSFTGSYACHTNWVRSVRYHPEGKILCTTSDDGTVAIIDRRTKDAALTIKVRDGMPNYAEFNPTADSYIGVSAGLNFTVFDRRTGSLVQLYKALHESPIRKFVFHPSGDFVYTVSEDKKIKILDVVEGRPVFTLSGPTDALLTVACSKGGKLFATSGMDKNILLWKPFLLPYSQSELQNINFSDNMDMENITDNNRVELDEIEDGDKTSEHDNSEEITIQSNHDENELNLSENEN